jgi:Ca2+-binding EF-hand superfamily protein
MSALEKFQLRDPLGYKNYLKEQQKKREAAFLASIMSAKKAKGAAKASPFGALFQKPAAAPTAPPSPPPPRRDKPGSPRGGVSATVVDTRTEAEMRRALSLPLLIPKKDRKKLMQQRPWRVDKNDDELIAARKPRPISEEPRFSEVGALRGEMPSPDPRYLPSLQAKEEKRSMEKRIIEARELAVQIRESNRHQLNQAAERRARAAAREAAEAALAPSSWEAADLGDGPFLTQSRSAPHLKRHSHLAPGLRPPGRLPPMSLMSLADELGAAADAAAPDVLKSHRRAVRDVAADHGSLDAQLAALSERMHALEPAMKPIQQKAAQREGKQLSLTANAVLNSALTEIRAKLIANMPRVMDLFRKFDKNGDGLIARSEFVQVLPMLGLPQYGAAEMEGMFDVLDADRSGTLDFHEMDRLLRRGADVQLAAALQVGAKGVIEVEARNRYSVREHARDGALQPQKDSSVEAMRAAMIRQAARVTDFFKHLDINSDGKVSKPEFRAALPLLGFGAGGIPAMDKLFEQLDVDGNGYVEYSELKVALRRDDIELAAPLQDGALGVIEVKAKNAIELRNVHGD